MNIWSRQFTVEELNRFCRNTLMEHLGIEFTRVGQDFLMATMPVDHRTIQPMGLLHGGASAALAESLGSLAATLCVDFQKQYCVGIELNMNHIRPVRRGTVTGTARPLHRGRQTHVWEIRIEDDQQQLVSVARLTLLVQNYNRDQKE